MPVNVKILSSPQTSLLAHVHHEIRQGQAGEGGGSQRQKDKRLTSLLPRTPEARRRIQQTLMPIVVLRGEDERR